MVSPIQSEVATERAESKIASSPSGHENLGGVSQTASEFIDSQLQLEADAREALPYNFDHCTQPLGPLRQSVFSCLTCNPPLTSPLDSYNPAGVCYSCSIACHGQHTLVELFNRRNFTCDCGTTRLPSTAPCTLRLDPTTGMKGLVHSQPAAQSNTYNQNFRNRFCGCREFYDPHQQKGTMFQCLGLETEQNGGCGEDWYHSECLLGLPRDWHVLKHEDAKDQQGLRGDGFDNVLQQAGEEELDHPIPPGFPQEDQIESVICYKCTSINPWIKRYAGTKGFLPPVYHEPVPQSEIKVEPHLQSPTAPLNSETLHSSESNAEPLKKRKAESDETDGEPAVIKKLKTESVRPSQLESIIYHDCRKTTLPKPSIGSFSLIASDENFRTEFCRCAECYQSLRKYPQLLEEEDVYEPPLSDEGDGEGDVSVGTGSLLERGEAALSNVDRVRAIEGVMVYNHLKDKVKSFLQPFAESGQAVGAEDIKAYFEKLRGDAEAIRNAGGATVTNSDGNDGGDDNRREQSGY